MKSVAPSCPLNSFSASLSALGKVMDWVIFNGRFGGVATDIFVPVGAVMGIYARENGQGMVFDAEEGSNETPPDATPPSPVKPEKRPSLKIVR